LAGVEALRSLRELYADHNGLESMAPLAPLTELHTLELSHNRLQALATPTPNPTPNRLQALANPTP
jgi:Leucine-rich repeat (LRR) protein